MRILRTFALVAVLLGLAATLAPAQATCIGTPKVFSSVTVNARSFVWTEGWDGICYLAGVLPPISMSNSNPLTPDFTAVYWELGGGNLAVGLGDDSGGYAVPPAGWVYWDNYYGAYQFAAQVTGTWAQSTAIDGCVANGVCECVLLSDQKDGVGYFAMLSGLTNANGDLDLTQAGSDCGWNGPIILKPIPAPAITRVDLNQDTNIATFNVTVGPADAGIYAKDGCNCGPAGYVLYQQAVTHGAPPPGSRDLAGWTPVTGVLPTGAAAVYDTDACTASDVDVYLATALVFDSGFPAAPYPVTLSGNSNMLRCGTTVAEPKPLAPRIRRQERDLPRTDRKR